VLKRKQTGFGHTDEMLNCSKMKRVETQ